ncbi:tetratricopeptide repeat (TPR)-like superfamily protein [Actinidia rufa]|uniref:Tetratricopeptide repeat (TPR)-like superfamily protein n=1 Tax=Actinidia rufa TaxID=165716 RepID=A0A7J0E633_9ERIC|nr:tetratricopeptide repeat (TPR)-like superfamily protein [Actinidia rufa]
MEKLRNTIARLIEECKNMRELKQIHSQITTSPLLPDPDRHFLVSRLLFSCAISEFGCLKHATDIFGSIQNPNLSLYNAMIRAYASKINNKDKPSSFQALILYKQLLWNGIRPNCLTFPFILKDCTRMLNYYMGRSVHGHAVMYGFQSDVFVQNSMISLYSACGCLNCALRVFDEMSIRDIVSWNSMIIGCLRSGELDLALDLFRRMEKRNNITWNSIITGFVQGGLPKEAIEFFNEMQSLGDDKVRPDKITVASVLSACASLGAIDQGKWVHSFLKRSGLECDIAIGTALVDMYGKCGCMERAVEVFKEMPKKDILAWTAMISVFALNGYGKEAFDLFTEMESLRVRPNSVTFVGLLSACAHSGLVQKRPLAKGLIRKMPMEPDVFVWGAFLGGCQMHGKLVDFNQVKRVRAIMNDNGIEKASPGCSMIEIDGIVHEFSVRGSPEVLIEEIICLLDGLSDGMKTERDMLDSFE